MAKYIVNPFTGQLDADDGGSGGGSSFVPYEQSVSTVDFTLNVSVYELSISAGTHGLGTTVVAQVFDNTGDMIYPNININGSGDIVISVSSSPDLRFNGKVIVV